jgi:hypothetical protein
MQKIVWWIGFLVSIFIAQSNIDMLQGNWSALSQSAVMQVDSTVRITGRPSDDVKSDVLQENLYVQILSEINTAPFIRDIKLSENKYQLLKKCQQYYPKVTLHDDTLIIPYPPQKLDRFKEVKYLIPGSYFSTIKQTPLQPQIQLTFNPDKSTLMINHSYLLSYYRTPGIGENSLERYKVILQYIYNLLLPYTSVSDALERYNNDAVVHYKGYTEHDIKLDSGEKYLAFWESLCAQGSLYFFPSRIDDLETSIHVYGLLYVMKDDIVNAYHFGELEVSVSKEQLTEKYAIELDFYPFVVNKQIGK